MSKDRNIFERRGNYKPFEYPEMEPFVKAIQRTYWIVDEA